MAKTAKLKKNTKSTSIHSRAARRATSPSINLDKSLKNVQLPSDDRSKVLLVHQGAGITKRKGKGKALSRQKRIRREKGSQRAEAVMDQMEKKVERVIVKGRTVKERGAAWEELNSKIKEKRPKQKPRRDNEEDGWEDNNTDSDEVIEGVTALTVEEPGTIAGVSGHVAGVLEDDVL